jgi:MoaA/NifB/PqqE/SkfB family radical SAM enzyme
MPLEEKIIREYANSRQLTDKSLLCHAPTVNLNFEQNGNVRACCYNTKHLLGTWPAQSIREIWTGDKIAELRHFIAGNDLGGGCSACGELIAAGNYQGVRARYFDEYVPPGPVHKLLKLANRIAGRMEYPKVMEFELSNNCNLECIMCNGYFSSSIRKNREHLPAMNNPYNDQFVDELDEFIPHLQVAKFLGGEPFMIDIYLKIWERIRKINPKVVIHITTNGTFLNKRIKELLNGLKAGFIVSIDSIVPETYRQIRVNGNFDKVMENLEYFRRYAAQKRTFLSLAACPMTLNWQELPLLLNFCLDKRIILYFNPLTTPEQLSLKEQTAAYLDDVICFLSNNPAPAVSGGSRDAQRLSVNAYNGFLSMLKEWRLQSIAASL